MSTGLVSVDRGFDFATEEHGVEIRRIQTNLSERRIEDGADAGRHGVKGKGTLRRMFPRRKPKHLKEVGDDSAVSGPTSPLSALWSGRPTSGRPQTAGSEKEPQRPTSSSSTS